MNALAEEFRQIVAGEFGHIHRKLNEMETARTIPIFDLDTGQSGSTNSAGFVDLTVWTNSTTRPVKISRILVWADGYTPASPYSNAAGWLGIFTGAGQNFATIKDYSPYIAGNPFIPNVANYSGANMPRFKPGDSIHLVIYGGPASTNINCLVSGYAEPPGSQRESGGSI